MKQTDNLGRRWQSVDPSDIIEQPRISIGVVTIGRVIQSGRTSSNVGSVAEYNATR